MPTKIRHRGFVSLSEGKHFYSMNMSFKLHDDFVARYADLEPEWGYKDAAGASLGEIVFLRTYSRMKDDGTKETWAETCRRVIEGMFSIQKDHVKTNRLPWSDVKAHRTAEDAYDRLFHFKWTPPGRGLWMMGTPLVMEQRNSAALQNCAFVSTGDMTRRDPAEPFAFLMEASMLGIGVGTDTDGAAKGFEVHNPRYVDGAYPEIYEIPDTREGWVESVRMLLNSYLKAGQDAVDFAYHMIRKAGEPIRTFGGTAAGPEPLIRLHERLRALLDSRVGHELSTSDIADIANLIGVCVVSGNVRRSAELLLGDPEDEDFLHLKDAERFPERMAMGDGWGYMSNNSVRADKDTDLTRVAELAARNGEPGVVWMDVSREYGRLVDPPNGKDWRAAGYNPCAEQTLESYECCTLVETYLNRHESLEDYLETLKVAYLYAKTVTLLPTHWEKTNAIMQRNRRIGASMSGLANFSDARGTLTLTGWQDEGYREIQRLDALYSEWLCVRESIKTTTVKPSGTVSILAGESPGAHWSPGGEFFKRRVTFAKGDPILERLRWSGYEIEESVYTPETSEVVTFYIRSGATRSEREVSLFEKAALAVQSQRYWSDNSVSVTLTFDPVTEAEHIGTILNMYQGSLKTVSFLPMASGTYAQMPYEETTAEDYARAAESTLPADLADVYAGNALDAEGEAYCTTDQCEIPAV